MSATAPLEQGKSASTIKTDLSAIRFFHDKMSHPKYTLPDNDALGVELERRRFGQQDRTWTKAEFGKLLGCAMAEGGEDYILALYLARYAGLRIHECFRMDTAAEHALRENALTVKGKGGKIRTVPIEDERITMTLQKLLDKTERGYKLLVPDAVPTDRGCHYRWPGWISRMDAAHLHRSMSKKGCSPDNSACEGFFGRMKNEMFYGVSWLNVSIVFFINY